MHTHAHIQDQIAWFSLVLHAKSVIFQKVRCHRVGFPYRKHPQSRPSNPKLLLHQESIAHYAVNSKLCFETGQKPRIQKLDRWLSLRRRIAGSQYRFEGSNMAPILSRFVGMGEKVYAVDPNQLSQNEWSHTNEYVSSQALWLDVYCCHVLVARASDNNLGLDIKCWSVWFGNITLGLSVCAEKMPWRLESVFASKNAVNRFIWGGGEKQSEFSDVWC